MRLKTQNEKSYFHTTCAIQEGSQPMFFAWHKNSVPIKPISNVNYKIETSDMFSTLTIKSIARSDAGNYTCSVSNAFGTASQSVVLAVKGKVKSTVFCVILF